MGLRSGAVEGVTSEEGESVNEGCNNGENSSYRQDIVEVGNYVISVVEYNVKGRVS